MNDALISNVSELLDIKLAQKFVISVNLPIKMSSGFVYDDHRPSRLIPSSFFPHSASPNVLLTHGLSFNVRPCILGLSTLGTLSAFDARASLSTCPALMSPASRSRMQHNLRKSMEKRQRHPIVREPSLTTS